MKDEQPENPLHTIRTLLRAIVSRFTIQVLVTLLAMLIGIFLMVGDEIIGFMNPSRTLTMHWPLGLLFTVWQSWEIVFVIILLGTVFYIILIECLLKEIDELRNHRSSN